MVQGQSLFLPHGERAILLLHAYSGSSNDVRMLARFLEKKNYTVYAPLYKGHGTTEPLDILQEKAINWWNDSQTAVEFLRAKGYQEIAVFGLSMGGIFATRLLEEKPEYFIGGGFFCSPIAPVKTNVVPNFLLYAKQLLEKNGETINEEQMGHYRSLVEEQLAEIEEQSTLAYQRLSEIHCPFFMAQAGQDEMVEAEGVFQTAAHVQQTDFTLKWYPDSSHVITVGTARRKLEQDVADFLATLGWRENNGEKNN